MTALSDRVLAVCRRCEVAKTYMEEDEGTSVLVMMRMAEQAKENIEGGKKDEEKAQD